MYGIGAANIGFAYYDRAYGIREHTGRQYILAAIVVGCAQGDDVVGTTTGVYVYRCFRGVVTAVTEIPGVRERAGGMIVEVNLRVLAVR